MTRCSKWVQKECWPDCSWIIHFGCKLLHSGFNMNNPLGTNTVLNGAYEACKNADSRPNYLWTCRHRQVLISCAFSSSSGDTPQSPWREKYHCPFMALYRFLCTSQIGGKQSYMKGKEIPIQNFLVTFLKPAITKQLGQQAAGQDLGLKWWANHVPNRSWTLTFACDIQRLQKSIY